MAASSAFAPSSACRAASAASSSFVSAAAIFLSMAATFFTALALALTVSTAARAPARRLANAPSPFLARSAATPTPATTMARMRIAIPKIFVFFMMPSPIKATRPWRAA